MGRHSKERISKKTKISLVLLFLLIAVLIFVVYATSKNTDELETGTKIEENIIEEETNDIWLAILDTEELSLANQYSKEDVLTGISSNSPYYIRVNYEANVVTVYEKDDNGDYVPYKAMICSCGTSTPTSRNIFNDI